MLYMPHHTTTHPDVSALHTQPSHLLPQVNHPCSHLKAHLSSCVIDASLSCLYKGLTQQLSPLYIIKFSLYWIIPISTQTYYLTYLLENKNKALFYPPKFPCPLSAYFFPPISRETPQRSHLSWVFPVPLFSFTKTHPWP